VDALGPHCIADSVPGGILRLKLRLEIAVNFAATSDSYVGSACIGAYLCCWTKQVRAMDHWQLGREPENFALHEDMDAEHTPFAERHG
jgi:hypothetical protein